MSETCCLETTRPPLAPAITLFQPPAPLPEHIANRAAARRKLWELPPHHHCLLLGSALDARELRQVYRRGGWSDWETATDYELHSNAVQHARSRNDVSRVLQKVLEERYAGAVAHLRPARDRKEVVVYWQNWAALGDPVGAYWAAISHPLIDADCDELLWREMHMLSHFAFAERRAAGRRLRAADDRAAKLEAARDHAQRQCEALRRANGGLRAEAAEWRRAARVSQAALERNAARDEIRALEARTRALERALAAAQRATRAAEREVSQLRSRHERAAGAPGAERDRRALDAAPTEDAPRVDLQRRTVLCVGGKTRLVPHYRALVEGASGAFAHHDGGIEDHAARLPRLLGAADAVVCLATDVSHCAYYAVKSYCKRFGKPCVLVGNSSVAALARSLGVLVGAAPAHAPSVRRAR